MKKKRALIAIGSSVATNCQPCLTFHVDKADELGISEEEIREALAIGAQVQKGGANAMQRFIEQSFDAKLESMSSQKVKRATSLKIYDPPMCCPTGICGPNVNESLVEFAGLLKQVEKQGIEVNRWNLSQQPQAFAENKAVRETMAKLGQEGLPLIYVDDKLALSGRYPGQKELFNLLGINENENRENDENKKTGVFITDMASPDSGGCCSEGGCC